MNGILYYQKGWILDTQYTRRSDEERLKETLGGTQVDSRTWRFPDALLYAYQILRQFPGVVLSPSAKDHLKGSGFTLQDLGQRAHPMWVELRKHQQESVDYLVSSPKHGALLALTPRLGKTPAMIVAAQVLGFSSVLIVTPLSLLHTWARECRVWSGIDPTIIHGQDFQELPEGWVVTNYDTLVPTNRKLGKAKPAPVKSKFHKRWDLIVLDESILVKNRKTQRYRGIKQLTGLARRVWLLSGAPISKSADDLFTQFHLIDPKSFRSYWRFAKFYCEVEESIWGKTVLGSKDIEFRKEFRDLMLVKEGFEVGLPEITSQAIDLALTPEQEETYASALDFLITSLHGQTLPIPTRMAQITRLQQIVSNLKNLGAEFPDRSSKADAVCELVLDARAVELPVIIWTHWRAGAEMLARRLRLRTKSDYQVAYLHGESSDDEREDVRRRFQQGLIPILILSLGVGKYGLTLSEAATMIYLDRTYSMDEYVQSYYRAVGMDKSTSPLAITLRCPGTTDDLIEENLYGKSIDLARVSNSDLLRILESMRKSHQGLAFSS